jgi:lipopolysaccharide export system permease protein
VRRLDRLVLQELIGPWAFGVAIFTVLIMAGTYLFRITDLLAKGVPFAYVMELSLLLLPGVMAKTFAMAVLLATLLAFGRLSGDSEIVAIKACGVSLARLMAPVAAFGAVVAVIAFTFNEVLVPGASSRATVLQDRITRDLTGRAPVPIVPPVLDQGRVAALVSALGFDFAERTLTGATVTVFGDDMRPAFFITADRLRFRDEQDWRISGGGTIVSADGKTWVSLEGDAWPAQAPRLDFTPRDILAARLRDLDALSMRQLGEQIARAKENPRADPRQIANLQYGYWNKLALPLAAVIYALVGAPLGIRGHRAGAATGFWLAVVIIFLYMLLANFMAIWAQGGAIPAWAASFGPIVAGALVAAITIWKRNN